jgi:hypothetical protein
MATFFFILDKIFCIAQFKNVDEAYLNILYFIFIFIFIYNFAKDLCFIAAFLKFYYNNIFVSCNLLADKLLYLLVWRDKCLNMRQLTLNIYRDKCNGNSPELIFFYFVFVVNVLIEPEL